MYRFIKRAFDIIASFILILILFLPMLIIGLLVKCTSKGPILFKHMRIGRYGNEFAVLKFRTMKNDSRPIEEILTKEEYEEFLKSYKLKNDPRVTRIGKILRKTSLDELPQLFNILKGDMSFVGPRPIIRDELDRLTNDEVVLYLSVRGGLTSYWAVNGRSSTSYEERIRLELYYVEHKSLWLDIKIFIKTFICAFKNSE